MGILNHEAKVIRIRDIEKHPNADNLGIVRIDGYQVIVRTDEFKVGDLAIFIQPDSVLPETEQFAWFWNDNK